MVIPNNKKAHLCIDVSNIQKNSDILYFALANIQIITDCHYIEAKSQTANATT